MRLPKALAWAIPACVRSWLGVYGNSRFCNTDPDDIVGLLESIRRLNRHCARALTSYAPDELIN